MINLTKELNCDLQNKSTLQKQIETMNLFLKCQNDTINLFLNYQKNYLTIIPDNARFNNNCIETNTKIINLINNFYDN